MARHFESSRFSAALTHRTFRFCLVVAVIGLMGYETASEQIIATSITPAFTHSDSPLWVDMDKNLYFVDRNENLLIRLNSGKLYAVHITNFTDNLKFVVHVSHKKEFIVGYQFDFARIPWDGLSNVTISSAQRMEIIDFEVDSVECGKVDPAGRLWAGASVRNSTGRFYTMDGKGGIKKQLDVGSPPGGFAWNLACDKIYFSDKVMKAIMRCSFDLNSGTIINDGEVFFDFAANNINGEPHGVTMDMDGNLWIACLKSDKVLKVDPASGKVLSTVTVPGAGSITSVDFGGENFQTLYVTTAKDDAAGPGSHENAGKVFEVTGTGATGIAPNEMDANW